MNERPDREAAKRRIMFVPGEDFYFLAYTFLVLLEGLGATSPDKALHDSRKLAYIADFMGGDSDLRLVITKAPLSASARSRLTLLYDRAVARRVAVERLVAALATRGLVCVVRNPEEEDRVYLGESRLATALLSSSTFQKEEERLKVLRGKIPQLRTMTLATFKQRLFGDRGVRTWGD
ncbi:hypothetical protein ACIHQR_29975 [Corallococcus coralloides]|uniref:hypothetical protein n=1 Tax=Corallococcus coralloides TaxID=184914 RepID=UPI0038515BFE